MYSLQTELLFNECAVLRGIAIIMHNLLPTTTIMNDLFLSITVTHCARDLLKIVIILKSSN